MSDFTKADLAATELSGALWHLARTRGPGSKAWWEREVERLWKIAYAEAFNSGREG